MVSILRNFLFQTFLAILLCFERSYCQDGLNFLVIGDWGGINFFPYRTPVESAVAKEMGKKAKEVDAQFVVALGNVFTHFM